MKIAPVTIIKKRVERLQFICKSCNWYQCGSVGITSDNVWLTILIVGDKLPWSAV